MLRHKLIHPQINEILGRAGHHAKVLIADGNYPASSKKGPQAELICLNLMPGVVTCAQVLEAVLSAVAIEEINTMMYEKTGPYALKEDPPVWPGTKAHREMGFLQSRRNQRSRADDSNRRSAAFREYSAHRWCEDGLMQKRKLGKTGLELTVLSFGASSLGAEFRSIDINEAMRAVHVALDLGMNFIDTSPFYGRGMSEVLLGVTLQDVPRDRYILGTKLGRYDAAHFDFSAKRVEESVDVSLHRLRTDHLDIMLCHDIEFVEMSQIVNETLPALRLCPPCENSSRREKFASSASAAIR